MGKGPERPGDQFSLSCFPSAPLSLAAFPVAAQHPRSDQSPTHTVLRTMMCSGRTRHKTFLSPSSLGNQVPEAE